jgi:hypothetical protein
LRPSEICDLSLRGITACASDPFTLPPSALPHLGSFHSIHVDLDALHEVAKVSEWDYVSTVVAVLASSKGIKEPNLDTTI